MTARDAVVGMLVVALVTLAVVYLIAGRGGDELALDSPGAASAVPLEKPPPPLIAIEFEHSGIDAGTIGYTIQVKRVQDLSDADFQELLDTIEALKVSLTLSGRHQN